MTATPSRHEIHPALRAFTLIELPVVRKRKGRAFTLIELLMVVVIIAALIALLVVSVSEARDISRTTAGLSNLRQIGQAATAYTYAWEDELPVGYYRQNAGAGTFPKDTDWTVILNADLVGDGPTYMTQDRTRMSRIFTCPNARVRSGRVHYSSHPILMPNLSPLEVIQTTYKLGHLRRPSDMLLIMDGGQDTSVAGSNSHATATRMDNFNITGPLYYNDSPADSGELIDPGPNEDSATGAGNIRWRQRQTTAANFLFADAHAATTYPADIRKRDVRPERP